MGLKVYEYSRSNSKSKISDYSSDRESDFEEDVTPHEEMYDVALIPVILLIKTHGSVSCGPRSQRVTPVSILTGRKKMQFSHLRSSVLP